MNNIKSISLHKMKKYILLYSAFIIYSGSTICAKMAALQNLFSFHFFIYLAIEITLLGVYAVIWQQVLKQFDLVTAMSSKGIVVILGLFWSIILFQETVTIYNLLGAILIVSGIWVVSIDE